MARIDGTPIAMITGGSRGIGLAAARELAGRGFAILVVSKSPESVAQAVTELAAFGHPVQGVAVDVADAPAVEDQLAAHAWIADVDVLVNSAGVMSEKMSKTLRTTSAEWQRVMSTNVDGVFNTIAAVVPHMVQRRSGRVINVSACLGRFSGPGLAGGLAPYRVSKAAVNAITKNLAAETGNGSRGVLVDAMCPNHTRTDMGGPDAPRSPAEGAETIVWLATRSHDADTQTGFLWEDRNIIAW
ncbi:unannotated protein [freshwater metagenome]|uniref:Unannotated protein n=1 Tax=freshwater metagenome TaxID=449393 RepID=A0A6J5ZHQ5_9ZZZZ